MSGNHRDMAASARIKEVLKTPSVLHFIRGGLYAGGIILLGYLACLQGLSHYYSDKAIRSGSGLYSAAAIRYQSDNAEAHKASGELLLRSGEWIAAASAFERAVAAKPSDFRLWLLLGHGLAKAEKFGSSRAAYARAIELAPNYSEPALHLGMLLLEGGEVEEAFRYLSHAANRDHSLYPPLLDRARVVFPDNPAAIENLMPPASSETKTIIAGYLIDHDLMTDNTRSFLTSDEPSEAVKNEFIRALIEKKNFSDARAVWLSKLQRGEAAIGPIFDGGFEEIAARDESGLGWQIDHGVNATFISRNSIVARSGASSLQIKFSGEAHAGRGILSQLAYVTPNRKYTLRIFVLSPSLVSAGLPVFTVSDVASGDLLASTPEFKSTGGQWIEYTCEFIAPDLPVVRIALQRAPCNMTPCPIVGELFLDDLEIAESANLLSTG